MAIERIEKIIFITLSILITIITIFGIIGSVAPEFISSGNNASGSGLPLAALYSPTGIIGLVFMAVMVLMIIGITIKGLNKLRE